MPYLKGDGDLFFNATSAKIFLKSQKMANKVSAVALQKKFKKFENRIKKNTLKILKILKKERISVDVYLADNKTMKFLNKKFRNKNKSANVLSFIEPKNFISSPIAKRSSGKKIGEIYLNMEQKDKLISKEFLIAHGILHLLGYDHIRKSDAIKMEVKEKSVSKKLKIF